MVTLAVLGIHRLDDLQGLFQSKQFYDSLRNLPTSARKAEAPQKFHRRQTFPESPADTGRVLVSIWQQHTLCLMPWLSKETLTEAAQSFREVGFKKCHLLWDLALSLKQLLLNALRLSSTNPHGCTKNPPNRKKTGSKSRIQLCHIQNLSMSKFHSKIERSTHYCGHSCGNYYL